MFTTLATIEVRRPGQPPATRRGRHPYYRTAPMTPQAAMSEMYARLNPARFVVPGRHVDPTRPIVPDPTVIAAMTRPERTAWEA